METLHAQLRRAGSPLAAAGDHLALYGTVLVLAMIGALKFTAYEAEAIRPLVETSPLLSWAYVVFSAQAFSNLLGVIELATAVLLALSPLDPRAGALGGLLAAGTFAITSTFLVTGPAWESSLGGFPALSARRRLPDQGSRAAGGGAVGARPLARPAGGRARREAPGGACRRLRAVPRDPAPAGKNNSRKPACGRRPPDQLPVVGKRRPAVVMISQPDLWPAGTTLHLYSSGRRGLRCNRNNDHSAFP